jgi:hypothetical protein
MDFTFDGIGHVLAGTELKVPKYQRSFKWGDRHVADLFNDLEKAITTDEKEYFLGTVVVADNDQGIPEVVDGEQRLATITILLAAIRDYFDEIGQRQRGDDIHQPFLVSRDRRSQEMNPRLTLNDADHDFFLNRILQRDAKVRTQTTPARESHKRLVKAAALAAAHIRNLAKTQSDATGLLLDRVDYIEKQSKILFVIVPSFANAFVIFETLNDRGLELAISDLLKNYLFLTAGKRLTEVQQKWVSMYDLFVSGDNEEFVVDFIRQLWSSRHGLTRERELYDQIKAEIKGPQSAVSFGNQLALGARYYQALVNPNHPLWAQYGVANQHMATLNQLGITRIRPLILAVLDQFSIPEAKKALNLMVSWAVRFMVVGGLGTGTLEERYSERANEIHTGAIKNASDLRSAMEKLVPSDTRFQEAFAHVSFSKSNLARYFLRVLERAANDEDQPELLPNENAEELNLEHIMPEEPADKWPTLDYEIYGTYHHRLGNLALMKQRENVEIANESPAAKEVAYASSKLKLTKMISGAIAKSKSWGPNEIDTRQKYLAKLAVAAWSLKFEKNPKRPKNSAARRS